MKKLVQLLLVTSVIVIVGCSKESNNENNPSSDEILESLEIYVNGKEGILEMGGLPFSNTTTFPSITSYPDMIKTTRSTTERIDLVFDVASHIKEVYFTINGASGYYVFNNDDELTNAESEPVSITIDIPSSINDGTFNANISVRDENESLSDLIDITISITDKDIENRVIHFSNFANNSTLSTLDFNTGEVVNIGLVGFQLSDIAFLSNNLYGVTLSSNLISIDLDTGQGTLVGNIGVSKVNALEGGSNILYAATNNGKFLSIDPLTAKGTIIGTFESGAVSSGDLVFDVNNEFLYGSLIVPGYSTDRIAIINPNTGETSFIGETGFNDVWGLALFRNQLLGLTIDGEFIIINPTTGKGTFIENTEAFSASGAAAIRKLDVIRKN
ncbi:hypothetical protein [Algibacter sp. 2305UL17-15]|uniref:hypothetical protein n=1 Tax=Algibacter sp. 2305UL17-15 TaxID=3231268 RepID=UPI00345A855A